MFGGLQVTPPPVFRILTFEFNGDLAYPIVPIPLQKTTVEN
jgi:hypothetical protein